MNDEKPTTQPVVRLAGLALDSWRRGDRYESSDASFGARLGLMRLGVSYSEVPAGKSGCPFHNHRCDDEIFVILEGEGLYRYGGEEYSFCAGDVLGAPAGGAETAHQIVNTGSGPLRYLAISGKPEADVIEYPDSGKFMVKTAGRDQRRFHFIGRADGEVDYWDGESGDG
jgi:uncharacterized cupin superfamily protein